MTTRGTKFPIWQQVIGGSLLIMGAHFCLPSYTESNSAEQPNKQELERKDQKVEPLVESLKAEDIDQLVKIPEDPEIYRPLNVPPYIPGAPLGNQWFLREPPASQTDFRR